MRTCRRRHEQTDSCVLTAGEHTNRPYTLTPPCDVSQPQTAATRSCRSPRIAGAKSRSPSSTKCIVFDWDDTLLASTYLHKKKHPSCPPFMPAQAFHEALSPRLLEMLGRLEDMIISVLSRAIRAVGKKNVIIITNAETGWIELSASRYVPKVLPLLKTMRLVSARSRFEMYCERPCEWKVHAFHEALQNTFGYSFPFPKLFDEDEEMMNIDEMQNKQHEDQHADYQGSRSESVYQPAISGYESKVEVKNLWKDVISCGDSNAERLACMHVCKEMTNTRVKTLKFQESPTLQDILVQLKTLYKQLPLILNCESSLDVAYHG